MPNGITIGFNFDELPADGEICSQCDQIITGTVYHPYVQVGQAQDANYVESPMCERCFIEFTGGGEERH